MFGDSSDTDRASPVVKLKVESADLPNMVSFYVALVCLGGLFLWFLFNYLAHGIAVKYRGLEPLNYKTVIITGASRGIGKEVAINLAWRGAKVILASSNEFAGRNTASEIQNLTGNLNVTYKHLDLADLKSVHEFAQEVNQKESRLDILINNAGVAYHREKKTREGYERVFGTNYLGHFLLTYLLQDLLKRSAPSRIINVASLSHTCILSDVNFKVLDPEVAGAKLYPELSGYQMSKFALVLHSKQLARMLGDAGVTANSLHPGVAITNIWRDMKLYHWKLTYWLTRLLLCTAVVGVQGAAQTIIYAAVAPELEHVTGKYFNKCSIGRESVLSTDQDLAQRLWDISLFLCGCGLNGKMVFPIVEERCTEMPSSDEDEEMEVKTIGPFRYQVFKLPSNPEGKMIERS